MITEDYVPLYVAELLKEKGFDEPCRFIYDDGRLCSVASRDLRWNEGYGELVEESSNSELSGTDRVCAPTLYIAMKWLRETHGIFININVGWRDAEQVVPEYGWWVERLYSAKHHVRGMVVVENTYKDACNAAIMYCLEKLV